MTAETFIAIVDPVEVHTVVHCNRIQLLDGWGDVVAMVVDALPGPLIGGRR